MTVWLLHKLSSSISANIYDLKDCLAVYQRGGLSSSISVNIYDLEDCLAAYQRIYDLEDCLAVYQRIYMAWSSISANIYDLEDCLAAYQRIYMAWTYFLAYISESYGLEVLSSNKYLSAKSSSAGCLWFHIYAYVCELVHVVMKLPNLLLSAPGMLLFYPNFVMSHGELLKIFLYTVGPWLHRDRHDGNQKECL